MGSGKSRRSTSKIVEWEKKTLYVKDCGMGEKKEGKEKEKCSTMPDVLIKGYKMGQHQKFTKACAAIPHK